MHKFQVEVVKILCVNFLSLVFFSCAEDVNKEKLIQHQGLVSDSAMVVSAHHLASKIGIDVIRQGGNAIDATVAVQFALAVVHPSAGNIGGGGFMVIRLNDGTIASLDYREVAPQSAHKDLYLDSLGEVIPRLSLDGHLAVGIPGTVDGMLKAHQKYGVLPWENLIQPAIDLAKNGFLLTKKEAEGLNRYTDNKAIFSSVDPSYITSILWEENDTLFLFDLAHTLELIRDNMRDGFYSGETAEKIINEMLRGNGIISYEDLDNYESVWRTPITGVYKNYKLISMSPPSSGGVCLLQMLKMVEPYPIKEWGIHSKRTMHLMVEAERRAFADRSKYLGDPDFSDIPLAELLDSAYIFKRMLSFNTDKASKSDSLLPGYIQFYESEETTHYSIVDSEGNAVSVTTTLNASYGSGVMVDGAGFLLNNEMDDFSSKPGTPNYFGLIGGEINAIQPNKRMLSSMTPSILEKDDQLFMVVGTPGGSTIITGVFQTIVNVIEHGLSMQQAVEAGRYHHQWLPDMIRIEKSKFDTIELNKLSALGHHITEVNSMNRVDAILILPDSKYEGGADPRGDDFAAGF